MTSGTPLFMRAPGEATGSIALESAVDEAAWACGRDPLDFRLANYAEVEPMTGKPFSAAQAHEWGLVNAVCEDEGLLRDAGEAAARIAANAPIAVRQAKLAISRGLGMSLAEGMALEIEAYSRLVSTQDRIEGVEAFSQKRRPLFKGC